MDKDFKKFVSTFKQDNTPRLSLFFYQAEMHLITQLKNYLNVEQTKERSFFSLINEAKKKGNIDTDKRFWDALLAFNNVSFNPQQQKSPSWLRFVNIIESLQNYNGSQLLDASKIKHKRAQRLYIAYMLTWEHLRYIAGNDDDFSPSSELLSLYSLAAMEEEHHH